MYNRIKCNGKIKAIIIMFFMVLMMLMTSFPVSAASSVEVSGGDSVACGDTFTIYVNYNGDSVGSVTANLTYDSNVLDYISGGSSSGNTGYIYLQKDVVDEDMSFQLIFKAKSEGDSNLKLETYEMYDANYNSLGTPSASHTVHVTAASKEETEEEETMATESSVENEATVSATTEASSEVQGVNPWILGGIAVVLILLIVLIAIKLKRKK